MSQFTERYKKMNPEQKGESIADNPILAYMNGVSEYEVCEALRADGWPDLDITNLITEAKTARNRVINRQ